MDQDEGNISALRREILLLSALNHPHIIRYIGFVKEASLIHIYLEYAPGGSIATIIKQYGCLNEKVLREYTKQLLEGLAYIHSHCIAHLDIKGENILLDQFGQLKLADFGAAKSLFGLINRKSTVRGTPYWMAPELFKQSHCGRQADIWSLGITIIEMATGHPLFFSNDNVVSVMWKIAQLKTTPRLPESITGDLKDFVTKCLQVDPHDRPTAQRLSKYQFITGNLNRSSYKPSSSIRTVIYNSTNPSVQNVFI